MYPKFAKEAEKEGLIEIAKLFRGVAEIEREHEKRYLRFLKDMKENIVFKRGNNVVWVCRNCGHIHFGKEAPKICPVCSHPQAFFEIKGC
jgi:rubrerythrin